MQEKFQQLIAKYYSDNIAPEEEKELLDWIEQDPENKKQFDHSKKLLEQIDRSFEIFDPDTEGEWNKLKPKLKETKVLWLKGTPWMRIAAVFIFLLGIGYIFNLTVNQEERVKEISTEEPLVLTEVDTPESEKTEHHETADYIYLPDKSKVYVGKESDVTYTAEDFGKVTRTVNLKGEAFFEIKRDETKPFVVNGGHTSVKVLGTSFTYKVHEGNEIEEVIVESGKVEFILKGSNKKVIVKAGRKGIYYKNSGELKRRRNNNNNNNWFRNLGEKIRNLFSNEEN